MGLSNPLKAADLLLNSASYALLNWQDHRGRTALHLAIKESNIDVANLLITRKCDVSLSDNKNRSALHWAAQLGRVDFVTNLIKVTSFDGRLHGYLNVNYKVLTLIKSKP